MQRFVCPVLGVVVSANLDVALLCATVYHSVNRQGRGLPSVGCGGI